jgi:D-aminoacyl-tRNA deacylase
MLAVVVSRADSASEHIGEHLRELGTWTDHTDPSRPDADGGGAVYRSVADGGTVELRAFDALHLETRDVAEAFGTVADGPEREPDLLVFASRHAGETGPLLTAHHTGNFGPAEFGGEDGSLARACPHAHSEVLAALEEYAPESYEVGTECTHHGPSAVGVPSMFVELGSDQAQWDDPAGARAVARAILALRGVAADAPAGGGPARPDDEGDGGPSDGDGDRRHLVGFGGGHYAPRFERVVRETDWAVGHVGADWCLDAMGDPDENREVLRAAFEASGATRALVEGEATDLEAVVEDLGYRVVSETWLRETGGGESVPLGLAADLEALLCPVADGLRFGERARGVNPDAVGEPTVVDLPTELLAAARGVDREATRAAVERATLAFDTTENGNRVADRAVLADETDREALVDDLVGILETRYDSVERADGAVVARETAFDPERACTLGVPEGPKFGRLAEGQPVDVDGETIDPAVVSVEREDRFPLD